MPSLILTGFMGTGKSTVGRKAAQRLGMNFTDTDHEIERITGMSVKEVFKKYGETRFRSEEKAAVRRISRQDNLVIATGGGLVMDPENLVMLKEIGLLISLSAAPEVIYNRVKGKKTRPLLDTDNPLETIKGMLEKRSKVYAEAHLTIDTSVLTLDQVVEQVVSAFEKYKSKGAV